MEKLVIFDLDGTLLNTIYDLAESTNWALQRNGFPTRELKEFNYFVGNGINKLFERALPEGEKGEENIALIRRDFLSHYDKHNMDNSRPYPGIPELLEKLQEMGVKLAVASNKYQAATIKLVAHYFPNVRFAEILGQREGIKVKPDPTIIYEILDKTGIGKDNTLYVGDSDVDMQTANNSGVKACGVTWGFRPRVELEKYSPAHIAEKAEDILKYI